MRFRSLLLIVVAFFLSSVAVGSAQEDTRGGESLIPSEIKGVIRVRGCTPEASQIDLRAQPLRLAGPDIRESPTDPRATDVPARVMTTNEPHVFRFSIRGLLPVTQYRLAIFLPPSPVCGKLFWRGASQGFAVSGGPPLLIEGVAATTSLEVLQPITDLWVGADQVDFTDSSAGTRRFRWRSGLSGIVGGELQVATAAFPTLGAFGACDEPEGGVVYRQQVPAVQGGWAEIEPPSFNRILGRRVSGGDGISAADVNGISASTYRLLLLGAPVYVRVVPITASGPACNTDQQGVPGWVIVARLPAGAPEVPEPPPAPPVLEPGAGHHYTPAYFFRDESAKLHPNFDEFGYRAIKPHTLPTSAGCDPMGNFNLLKAGFPLELLPAYSDPFGCQLVLSGKLPGGATLQVGQWFYYAMSFSVHNGGSAWSAFTDTFGSLVTGFVNAAGLLVTTAADLYNGAVNAVKQLAYEALLAVPGVGQLCDANQDLCKQAIATGMTYGMTAMGLPPSLPNWDSLKDEGIEYLAHEVGEQLEEETNIPAPLTEAVLKELTQKAIDQMTEQRGGSDPAVNWLMRYNGFDPASWIVAVKKNGLDPLPLTIALQTKGTLLFRGTDVPLPRRFPPPLIPGFESRVLRVPIVLQPSLLTIPAPLCRASFYTVPNMQCFGIFSPFAKPICQYQTNTGPGSPWHDDPDCAKYGDMVAIYYRNAWVQGKLDVTSCTTLFALTLAEAFGASFALPGFTFVIGANVPPSVPATWDGQFLNACGGG